MLEGWRRQAILGVVAALVVIAVGVAIPVGPYVLDDLRLDRIVRAVALDWRDFGEDKARSRLQYELDKQQIGMQVGDDDCSLRTVGADKVVECAWTAVIRVPVGEAEVPLSFHSVASISPDGDLR